MTTTPRPYQEEPDHAKTATILGILASLAITTSALAHECVNASKSDQAAGAQVLVHAMTGEILWMTPGLAERFALGLIGPDGEGFHGLLAFDFDGGGEADISTWVGVGPRDSDEIPPRCSAQRACLPRTDEHRRVLRRLRW